MPAGKLTSIAERLSWAVEQQPARGRRRGIRMFQRQMEARTAEQGGDVSGTALSTIRGYLAGDHEPSVAFLREAAGVLNVRAEWLAFGSGLPTEEEESLGDLKGVADAALLSVRRTLLARRERVWSTLNETVARWWELPHAARAAVLRGFDVYVRLPSTRREFGRLSPAEADPELARRYAEYLAAPFAILQLDAAALGAEERAMMVGALLQPLEVAAWAADASGGGSE